MHPRPKPEALDALAAAVLGAPDSGVPNPASLSLLRRDDPAFTAGGGPPGGTFADDLDAMCGWVTHLDGSCIAIQGPPGTGKTYWGAHLVHALVGAGRRVGITAMSHHAIDNLLEGILQVFDEKGDRSELKAVRKVPAGPHGACPASPTSRSNGPCAKTDFNLVAGTTWLFAGPDLRGAPVDVLIVDEAGQLALADALAASIAAKNLVLLGDPLQLPQVAQAVHPGGGGASVLQHVLGEDVTMPPDRGVFLTETRRMHPDVCRFISDEIYEGRLQSHPDCARQRTPSSAPDCAGCRRTTTAAPPSPRRRPSWWPPRSAGLLGTPWANEHGRAHPLAIERLHGGRPVQRPGARFCATMLDADARTRGVPVGTVDKFQGREAAVVFFTMTTSSAADMPRARSSCSPATGSTWPISRARCLAYLVCTEELLNSRARTVEEMRLISTLCSFVEYSSLPTLALVGARGREPRLSAPRNSTWGCRPDLGYPPQVSGICRDGRTTHWRAAWRKMPTAGISTAAR